VAEDPIKAEATNIVMMARLFQALTNITTGCSRLYVALQFFWNATGFSSSHSHPLKHAIGR